MLLALMVSAVQCATAVCLRRIALARPAMHAVWMSKTLTVAASQGAGGNTLDEPIACGAFLGQTEALMPKSSFGHERFFCNWGDC